jgi:hypothetical protein
MFFDFPHKSQNPLAIDNRRYVFCSMHLLRGGPLLHVDDVPYRSFVQLHVRAVRIINDTVNKAPFLSYVMFS